MTPKTHIGISGHASLVLAPVVPPQTTNGYISFNPKVVWICAICGRHLNYEDNDLTEREGRAALADNLLSLWSE